MSGKRPRKGSKKSSDSLLPSKKAKKDNGLGATRAAPTVDEIVEDPLTKLALEVSLPPCPRATCHL